MATVTVSDEETGVRRVRMGGVRRFIADRMLESLADAAQLSFHAEANATGLLRQRAVWKAAGSPIGVEDCLIAAFVKALRAQPDINGTVTGDEIILSDAIHVAIAIAAPDGLKTPVLRDAGAKTVEQIAVERRDLVSRALAKKLQVSEMKGGTATISNLGMTRIQHFTPILNGGQMALLGIGCVTPRLALDDDGSVVERQMLGLSLTVDHRVVDGEPAGRLLTRICEEIEAIGVS